MGNVSESKEPIKDIEHTHERLRSSGRVRKDGKTYIQAFFPVLSQYEYDEWKKNLNHDPCLETQNAFLPVDTSVSSEGMCGKSYIAKGAYPGFFYVLADQIKNRKRMNQQSNNEQLWALIYSLSKLASNYHAAGKPVGDIRPENIFFNEDREIKVVTQDSWPQQDINYKKTLKLDQKTYLSPEQAAEVELGKVSPDSSAKTNEAFSIGLSSLDLALLESSEELYRKKGEIDVNKLNSKKNRLLEKKELSPLLKSTILSLLQLNPYDRITPKEIEKWLQVNKVEILNFHPFKQGAVPAEIAKTAERNGLESQIPTRTFINQVIEEEGKQLPQKLEQAPPSKLQSGATLEYPPRSSMHSRLQKSPNYQGEKVKSSYNPPPENYTKETQRKRETYMNNVPTQYAQNHNHEAAFQPTNYQPQAPQQNIPYSSPSIRTEENLIQHQRAPISPRSPSSLPTIPPQIEHRHEQLPRHVPEHRFNPQSQYMIDPYYARQPQYNPETKYHPQPGFHPEPKYTPQPRFNPEPRKQAKYTPSNYTPSTQYKPIINHHYNKETITHHTQQHKKTINNTHNQNEYKPIPNNYAQYKPTINHHISSQESSRYQPQVHRPLKQNIIGNSGSQIKEQMDDIEQSEISQDAEYKMDFLPHIPKPSIQEVITKKFIRREEENQPIVRGGINYNAKFNQQSQRISPPQTHEIKKKKESPSKNIYNERQIEERMKNQITKIIQHPI